MAFSRVTMTRISLFRQRSLSSLIPFSSSPFTLTLQPIGRFSLSASLSTQESTPLVESASPKKSDRWKPMCLYYTQGKCTKMDDPIHLETFNHNCSGALKLNAAEFKHMRSQQLDFFLVLDLEGKVEILEFPVLMIDAKTMDVMDLFHRFVRPSEMSEQRINEYIDGKYGKLGVDRVWHDTAIPFKEVIEQFEAWMAQHHLWEQGGRLNRAAFVTCGNWDLKTKVPQQCKVARMKLPPYFMEWINLKDIYLNFYKRRATGMITMMKELQIPLLGSHHLGIDDTKNIARVLQHMLTDGALLQITARRNPDSPENVEFLFKNRIR
uniref:Exonuclease domain-containing protein n=1 Tax=Davidia involucrata TaxID=16924 RepID=A0A5B7BFX1_DAVIN